MVAYFVKTMALTKRILHRDNVQHDTVYMIKECCKKGEDS